MKKSFTEKLYHKKYPYKIQLQTLIDSYLNPVYKTKWNLPKIIPTLQRERILFKNTNEYNDWISYLDKIESKTYTTVSHIRIKKKSALVGTLLVYVKNKTDYDDLIKKFYDFITEVVEPINDNHLEKLLDNTTIIFRKKLFYNKYKYSIKFARRYKNNTVETDDITDWVKNQFIKDENIDRSDDFLFRATSWYPTLYINDSDDLILVNLSFNDKILEIKQIELLDSLTS